jgi:hypothetical protein
MVVDLLGHEDSPGALASRPRAWRWVAGLAAVTLVAGVLGLLANDEVRANSRFDRSDASLTVVRQRIAVVRSELAVASSELHVVDGLVAQDHVALGRDTAQLQGVQQALAGARAHLSYQARDITDLRACLTGVEQALNALAVNDRGHAIAALSAVAPNCNAAVTADG